MSLVLFAMELIYNHQLKTREQPGGQNTMDPDGRHQINKEDSTAMHPAVVEENVPKPVGTHSTHQFKNNYM